MTWVHEVQRVDEPGPGRQIQQGQRSGEVALVLGPGVLRLEQQRDFGAR